MIIDHQAKISFRHGFFNLNVFPFQNIVDEQLKTIDESYERNFIDSYLNKVRQAESDSDKKSHFSSKTNN